MNTIMSRRPGRIKLSVDVPEPKPRSFEFLSTGPFAKLQHDLLKAVQDESFALATAKRDEAACGLPQHRGG